MRACIFLVLVLLLTAGCSSGHRPSEAGTSSQPGRGPWLLAALPSIGSITWSCDLGSKMSVYTLAFRARRGQATSEVRFVAGGKTIRRRVQPGRRISFPHIRIGTRQRIEILKGVPIRVEATVTVSLPGQPEAVPYCRAESPPPLRIDLRSFQ